MVAVANSYYDASVSIVKNLDLEEFGLGRRKSLTIMISWTTCI